MRGSARGRSVARSAARKSAVLRVCVCVCVIIIIAQRKRARGRGRLGEGGAKFTNERRYSVRAYSTRTAKQHAVGIIMSLEQFGFSRGPSKHTGPI